jgi:hypothetical protein
MELSGDHMLVFLWGVGLRMKKTGAVSRPGTLREFQFPEYTDSVIRVKRLGAGFVYRGSASPSIAGVVLHGGELTKWGHVRTLAPQQKHQHSLTSSAVASMRIHPVWAL